MIGRTLGHYRILEKLGAGGMGVVYVAQDTLLGRKAAVKVIKDGTTADETARARLLREARLASALNHPNICTVYEIGVDSSDAQQTYIAMELIEGRPLSTVIPAEGLPFDQVFRYAAQIAEALAHAHDRGVIHRDLKSANVMVLPDGRLKVLDFGLAKQMEQAADATTLIHEEALTRAGVIVGTLAYMSPEAVRGGPVDARSDIWSLGVLLYEMASGWRPFQGTTLLDLTAAILRDAVPESSAHACRQLHPILQRCLAKDPAQRYQSVGEMRVALDAIWSPQNRPAVAAKILDRRKWLWVAGGALALGLALAGRIWLWSPPRAKAPLPSTIPEANEYLRLAQNALETGQDAERIRQLSEQALKLDPKFAAARVLYAFGHLLEVDGGRSHDRTWLYRAEEELDRALQDDPTSARAHAVRAFVYLYQGRKDLIPAEAGKALELDPNEIDGYMMMAFYHQLNGEFEQSQKLLQKVLDEFDPLFTPALSNFGENLRLM